MTDAEAISAAFSCSDPTVSTVSLVQRNGRTLLALPHQRDAATRTLQLYQPQRRVARLMAAGLGFLVRAHLHPAFLRRLDVRESPGNMTPLWSGAEPGTCGILLGSPEHKVRRAIASYRHQGEWEVAKIAFGNEGCRVLEQEAAILRELQPMARGAPNLLGLHYGPGLTFLRMPYVTGTTLKPRESSDAIRLLNGWIGNLGPMSIDTFPEWHAIKNALIEIEASGAVLESLAAECLIPVICHGDFARWNLLRQKDGCLVVLDWEWGHLKGMPGIDLVHYFLQDSRLVQRLKPPDAVKATCKALAAPQCRQYLEKTCWSGNPLMPIIASLAYKQGAGHQENREILKAAVKAIE